MSKKYLKEVFGKLTSCRAWSLQLLQIKNSIRNGTTYISREISIHPDTKVMDYIEQLSDSYCKVGGYIDKFSSVDDYTGDVVNNAVYKISRNNQLLKEECDSLLQATANPNREAKVKDISPNALILQGVVKTEEQEIGDTSVILVSIQRPITFFKNKFALGSGEAFKEITEPILTLRNSIDVAIIGDMVYLFKLSGEKLFNMERSYRALCEVEVVQISQCDFLTDAEAFKTVATQGRNPRRFVSFNQAHFDVLKNIARRHELADKFKIPMCGDNIATERPEDVEKLVKFLCNKAMLDPCDSSPMKVSATKPWGK